MLPSAEHSSIKQQGEGSGEEEGGVGEKKEEKKEIKRDGARRAERRKAGGRGGDSESIWNMFTGGSLGPDVILALHSVDQNSSSSCSIVCPFPLSYLYFIGNSLFPRVRPALMQRIYRVSLLYTSRSVQSALQSRKATMGSGLVHANVNNPPSSSNGKEKRGLRNGLLGYRKSTHLKSTEAKRGHKNSLDQSNRCKTVWPQRRTKVKEFSQLCPRLWWCSTILLTDGLIISKSNFWCWQKKLRDKVV